MLCNIQGKACGSSTLTISIAEVTLGYIRQRGYQGQRVVLLQNKYTRNVVLIVTIHMYQGSMD